MANRRAQIAANEVVALRNDLNALREDLSKAHEDLATEKLKCSAAVNKIQQVGWLDDRRDSCLRGHELCVCGGLSHTQTGVHCPRHESFLTE